MRIERHFRFDFFTFRWFRELTKGALTLANAIVYLEIRSVLLFFSFYIGFLLVLY